MNIYSNNELMLESSIVTIGAFDGLHRGHQSLIKQAVNRAKLKGIPSVVYTFNPPPRALFQHKRMLTTVHEKVELLKSFSIDYVIVANFNKSYASRRPIEFIYELEKLHPEEIIVGPDFTFGKGKQGDVHLLRQYFQLTVHPFVSCEKGEIISSTRIRELIDQNEMKQVENLLGRQNLEVINI